MWAAISSGVTNENAAFERVEGLLARYGRDDYVRLRLSGGVAPGTRLDVALMEERLGSSLGSLTISDATTAHDYASIAREPTVRGHVVRDLLERGAEGEAALRYALAAFDGAEIAPGFGGAESAPAFSVAESAAAFNGAGNTP